MNTDQFQQSTDFLPLSTIQETASAYTASILPKREAETIPSDTPPSSANLMTGLTIKEPFKEVQSSAQVLNQIKEQRIQPPAAAMGSTQVADLLLLSSMH